MSQHGEDVQIFGNAENRPDSDEYLTAKENIPILYDFLFSRTLEWPSLTVQWLPDVTRYEGRSYSTHHLILGTHTLNSPNSLLIYGVDVPNPIRDGEPMRGCANEVDENGYGSAHGKSRLEMEIAHEGEVNKARYMPQNHNIIATRPPLSDVYIFDCTKHPVTPQVPGCYPHLRLRGHTREGFGLSWNKHLDGYLLTGAEDNTICLWDVNAIPNTEGTIEAQGIFVGHTGVVEDVDWHPEFTTIFASASSDKHLMVWDTRIPARVPMNQKEAHEGGVNCISFNPFVGHIFATGSTDKTAVLWDMRNLSTKLHTFTSHENEVLKVQWSPSDETILASSAGRFMHIWDLGRIGEKQSIEDAEDGPSELVFVHANHVGNVSDFSWNPKETNMICSVSDDNYLQIWQMAKEIFSDGT